MNPMKTLLTGLTCLTVSATVVAYPAVPNYAVAPFNLQQAQTAVERLNIALPTGQRVVFNTTSKTKGGITTIKGKQGDNHLLVTTDGKHSFGRITTATESYRLDSNQQGSWLVDESALGTQFIDDNQSTLDQSRELAAKVKAYHQQKPTGAIARSTVDIAVFFTPRLEQELGVQGVRTKAQFLIDLTQEVFDNSGAEVTINPVFFTRFDETLGAENDNQSLLNGTDGQNMLPTNFSTSFGADIQHIITAALHSPICGRSGGVFFVHPDGTLELNFVGIPVSVFSDSGNECFDITFAHEIGHVFVANHDRATFNGGTQGTDSMLDYFYGSQCAGKGTMMNSTLGAGNRHPFFSSPNITREGEPCGIAIGQPDAEDNVSVIEFTRSFVENINPPMAITGDVSFAQTNMAVSEGQGSFTFTLQRSGGLGSATSVEVATLDDVAIAGQDFSHFLQRVEFAAGEASKTVTITLLDDNIKEADESFNLVLRWPFKMQVVGSDIATVTITNDDIVQGQINFAGTSQTVAENAGNATINVTRSGGSDGELAVTYATADDTAIAGTDYTASNGTVVFAAGQTSQQINIGIINNSTVQGSRRFTVALSGNGVGSLVSTAVTITDDDTAPPATGGGNSNSGSSSGGGGSLGWPLLLLGLLGFGRKKIK